MLRALVKIVLGHTGGRYRTAFQDRTLGNTEVLFGRQKSRNKVRVF